MVSLRSLPYKASLTVAEYAHLQAKLTWKCVYKWAQLYKMTVWNHSNTTLSLWHIFYLIFCNVGIGVELIHRKHHQQEHICVVLYVLCNYIKDVNFVHNLWSKFLTIKYQIIFTENINFVLMRQLLLITFHVAARVWKT